MTATDRAPLLDTHAWVWWVEQDARLGAKAIAVLDSLPRDRRPFLCDISLWEVATLVERGRLALDVPLEEWLDAAAHLRSVRLLPVSPRIAAEVARLPETFHRDPADRLIVATSRVHRMPVLTHDDRILTSRLVSAWRVG
ncbi:MAG TPA: type II toxin-antitoxin system VapC family toxin [Vicinamibacterales bacterium]|jgi:PIN domain nuclease of toxin-antitoxin system